MDLRSHHPYWLMKNGLIKSYPSLQRSCNTEVVVIGAGITGALVSYYLSKAGFRVIVVDRRHVGMGSTAASTSLLQYEIDKPLHKLMETSGEERAVRSYRLCVEAVGKLTLLARQIGNVSCSTAPSLQFASYKKHVRQLTTEFKVRIEHHISQVEWLTAADIRDQFGFEAPAGMLSADGATLDAYQMTHALLARGMGNGVPVWSNSEVTGMRHHKSSVDVMLARNLKVTCRHVVICCGYESQRYLPKQVEHLRSTYAIISEPIKGSGNFWYGNSMIWETAVPYLYLRTTCDRRILIGGKDSVFSDPHKRDSLIRTKTHQLEKSFARLFPHIPFRTDFAWAGTFCETRDGLPFVGSVRQLPNTFFALGFGGNGITFSLIAAEILAGILSGKKSGDESLFTFNR